MEITIKGTAKEIANLVMCLQNQQNYKGNPENNEENVYTDIEGIVKSAILRRGEKL